MVHLYVHFFSIVSLYYLQFHIHRFNQAQTKRIFAFSTTDLQWLIENTIFHLWLVESRDMKGRLWSQKLLVDVPLSGGQSLLPHIVQESCAYSPLCKKCPLSFPPMLGSPACPGSSRASLPCILCFLLSTDNHLLLCSLSQIS